MEKFNLKKAILENKATFLSSLDEGDLVKNIGKGLEYESTEEMIRDYASGLFGDTYDPEELADFYLSKPNAFPKSLDYEFFKNNYDDILSVAMTGLGEGKKEYYKDAEADDAEHIKALEKDMKDDKKSSKMKMSELKAKIKEMALAEMNLDINDETPESEEDFLAEVEAILAEADEVAVDDTEVAVGGEENIDVNTTVEVDPNVKAVQDALTQAQAAAQKLGDSKLTDQIGNTITFFTRAHVVEKGAVAEDLNENTPLSPVNLTKQNFDKIENSPLSKEYDEMFSILDNLISKYPEFEKIDIIDYFKLLAIDKYFNPGYLVYNQWRKKDVAEDLNESMFPMLKRILK